MEAGRSMSCGRRMSETPQELFFRGGLQCAGEVGGQPLRGKMAFSSSGGTNSS